MTRKVFRREDALADFEGRPGTRCPASRGQGKPCPYESKACCVALFGRAECILPKTQLPTVAKRQAEGQNLP